MKSWIWILVVFAGSLPIAAALQYYLSGEPAHNTSTRNWLVVGQVLLGIAFIGFGLYKQIQASRQAPEPERKGGIKFTDEE